MMGEPVGRQDRLFYEFDLEDMVPGNHLLRRIDAALDLSWPDQCHKTPPNQTNIAKPPQQTEAETKNVRPF